MAAIVRRGRILPISTQALLATDDDVNGTSGLLTQAYDVTGASRVIIIQERSSGGNHETGVDVLGVSHDAGKSWEPDDTLMAGNSNDMTGDSLAGVLTGVSKDASTTATSNQFAMIYKAGPWEGPTCLRIFRDTTGDLMDGGTDYETGAPSVYMYVIGGDHEGGAPDSNTSLR